MEYTLDELVDAVASHLEAAGIDRQGNGQVSAFPDRRTLRYYTTIGLMARPDAVRDRQAIYGDHHIAQAVAVKRLQASGMALAAIQGRLAGLPLAEVEAIASGRAAGPSTAGGRRFWAQLPATAAVSAASQVVVPRAAPAPPLLSAPDGVARPMVAISLADGATLLLDGDQPLSPADISGIRQAASALLEHLDHLTAAAHRGADDRKDQA